MLRVANEDTKRLFRGRACIKVVLQMLIRGHLLLHRAFVAAV
jgi:hypothetical protein